MKLYYMPGACSLSPHIVLNEAGLAFDKVKVDGKTKATEAGGDYRTVNPLGYVPLLELDDGTKISEGPAIVQWIADKVPAKNLAPANGTMERTKLQSWLNFVSTELHKGFSPLFNPTMPDEAKKFFRDRLATRFAELDKHFAKNEYLLGKSFSVAPAQSQGSRSEVARGKYRVQCGGCIDCHTPGYFFGKPDMAKALAGSEVGFEIPDLGVFYGPNLTPDKDTGLGTWSKTQIV